MGENRKPCMPGTPEYEELIQGICEVVCNFNITYGQLRVAFSEALNRLTPGGYINEPPQLME